MPGLEAESRREVGDAIALPPATTRHPDNPSARGAIGDPRKQRLRDQSPSHDSRQQHFPLGVHRSPVHLPRIESPGCVNSIYWTLPRS